MRTSSADSAADPGYDPFSYRIHEDPYPVYAWMREHAPLYRNADRDFWAFSRYDDVLSALRNPELFSSRNGISLEPDLWGPHAVRTSSFLAMDPPEHGRIRRLVASVFKPRQVATLQGRVRELARERLEPLLEWGTFDFASDFAAALPNDVMCELIGVPTADRDQLRADNDCLNHCEDGIETRSNDTVAAGSRLAVYYVELIKDRRKHPGDDLLSAVLHAKDGEPQTDAQALALLFLLLSGTNDSAGKLIGNAWYYGWRLPEVRRAGLNGRAVAWGSESLRYDSPSQMVARTLSRDTVFHGTSVPAGARMVLLPASANRDRRMFPDPDKFDIDRDTSKQISFGHGPHFCLGVALANLEITVALQELGAAVSDYEIDMAGAQRVHSPHQRGFATLPTRVTCRPRRLRD